MYTVHQHLCFRSEYGNRVGTLCFTAGSATTNADGPDATDR